MKKLLSIVLLFALCALLFTGCSSMYSYDNYASTEPYVEAIPYESYSDYAGTLTYDENVVSAAASNARQIRNAWVSLEVTDIQKTYSSIKSKVIGFGGYEFSMTSDYLSTYKNISATIKIPPEHLDAFLAYLAENFDMTHCQTSTEDITESYFDAETHLKTLEATLDSYYVILSQATSIDDILEIRRMIDEQMVEIDMIKGRLARWNTQTQDATVDISLYEYLPEVTPDEPLPAISAAMPLTTMGSRMMSGLSGVCSILLGILQWLLIAVVTLLPLLILAAVIVFVVLFLVKRGKKNR